MIEEYRCPVCYAISKTHMCNPQNYHRNKLESDFKELQAQNSKMKEALDKINDWCHGNIENKTQVTSFCIEVRDLIEQALQPEQWGSGE